MNLLTNINQYSQNIIPKIPQTIEEVTYDSYEGNNPFSKTFNNLQIEDKNIQSAVDTTKLIGAEAFSLFTNPFYLTHKFVQIPTYYKTIVENYTKTSKQHSDMNTNDQY